jgi:hypothetical protein
MAESIEQPNHASLYVGKYADANLLTIIPKIFTANLEMKDVSISSLAYFRDLYSFTAFEYSDKLCFSAGGTLSTHSFDNTETTLNIGLSLLRLLPENRYIDMDLSAYTGLSYVFGDINYEFVCSVASVAINKGNSLAS